MHSRIYVGQVRHRRYAEAAHAFRYRLFMLYLDLDELPQLFNGHWCWSTSKPALARFCREDHLGDASTDLASAVRQLVESKAGFRPAGPVRLLTNLRYFGYGFNPVSFYYCFDQTGENVQAVVAEVNNTPWGEQYCYVLTDQACDSRRCGSKRYRLSKLFHVSPFMAMDIDYDWRFSVPGERLAIHMKNHHNDELLFDATLSLRAKPVTSTNLARVLVRFPFMTAKIVGAIYYQALRLWLKKVPFHPHPANLEAPDPVRRP